MLLEHVVSLRLHIWSLLAKDRCSLGHSIRSKHVILWFLLQICLHQSSCALRGWLSCFGEDSCWLPWCAEHHVLHGLGKRLLYLILPLHHRCLLCEYWPCLLLILSEHGGLWELSCVLLVRVIHSELWLALLTKNRSLSRLLPHTLWL